MATDFSADSSDGPRSGGNIVEFGHVNVRVPDQALALAFYIDGLGLTRDPELMTGFDNAWINVGASQFHLPVGPAQVLRGRIGLVLPDLDGLLERFERVAPRLRGTRYALQRDGAQVDLHCPWGNRIRVHAGGRAPYEHVNLGMPYVELDVAPGSAARIARFYAEILAAPGESGRDPDGACYVRIPCGAHTSLVYRETAAALPAYDGHHVQISVADFTGVHERLRARGLISEESSAHQYRFEDLVDLDSGERLTALEHEVRSTQHPLYARVLVNRAPGTAR